jgi:hypothetical protein
MLLVHPDNMLLVPIMSRTCIETTIALKHALKQAIRNYLEALHTVMSNMAKNRTLTT